MLAASSLLGLATHLWAAGRPHYGGTLHVSVRESPESLDPASAATANISRMVFETLVGLDERGRPRPALASSWRSEPGNQRWRFFLRGGVSFHDGAPLDAGTVVASLRNSGREWKVVAAGDTVIVEAQAPDPYLPAELALARHSIVRRSNGTLAGTGPFAIVQWVPGKHASLAANDEYWGGRPFLDAIEVDFGRNERDQLMALDLGRSDIAELAPETIRRARNDGRMVLASEPEELLALVFAGESRSEDETDARNALAAAVDTEAISNVVLQGGGEAAASLLPNWLSGYGFTFSGGKPQRSAPNQAQVRAASNWTLSYDASDAIARVIAERILLNARDAGLTLQLSASTAGSIQLVRVPLSSAEPHVALIEIARALQLASPSFGGSSVADLYATEKALLQSRRALPLLHLRRAVAVRPGVRDWRVMPDGSWQLAGVWLSAGKP